MREPGMFLRMSVISSSTQQLSSLPPLELSRNLCEVSQLCGLVYQRFLKPLPPNNEDKKEFPLADPRNKFKLFSCTNSSYLLIQSRQTGQHWTDGALIWEVCELREGSLRALVCKCWAGDEAACLPVLCLSAHLSCGHHRTAAWEHTADVLLPITNSHTN